MCTAAIAIGVAIGATTGAVGSAITGQDVGRGALMGGLMGGVTGGMGGLGPGGTLSTVGSNLGTQGFFQSANLAAGFGANLSAQAIAGYAATSLASSVLIGKLTPGTPEYYNAYQQQQQQYNSQPSTVTGSGGKQAAYSLAESVRRAKKRKLTQEDVSDLSIDTSSFASEGLQFA